MSFVHTAESLEKQKSCSKPLDVVAAEFMEKQKSCFFLWWLPCRIPGLGFLDFPAPTFVFSPNAECPAAPSAATNTRGALDTQIAPGFPLPGILFGIAESCRCLSSPKFHPWGSAGMDWGSPEPAAGVEKEIFEPKGFLKVDLETSNQHVCWIVHGKSWISNPELWICSFSTLRANGAENFKPWLLP